MTDSRRERTSRLLVEGLVIVASILMAFGLDAWWDGVGTRRAEVDRLSQLRAEFLLNDSVREADRLAHERHQAAAAELLRNSLGGSRRGGEELVPLLLSVYALRTHSWAGGSLRALIASGELTIISDPELRAALSAWPDLMTDLYEDEKKDWDFTVSELRPAIDVHIPSLVLWAQTPFVPSDLQNRLQVLDQRFAELLESERVLNAVATRLANAGELVQEIYPPLDEESGRIVHLIDEQLQRLGGR